VQVHRALATTSAVERWQSDQTPHGDRVRGCDVPTPLGERRGAACTWTVASARGQAVLVGDSQAGQFTEPFVRAANNAQLDATVATFHACPFAALRVVGSFASESDCGRFDNGTLATLVRTKPNLVVIALRTDGYVYKPSIGLGRGNGHVTFRSSEKADLWREGLAAYLNRLNRAHIPVVVIHPIPVIPFEPSACAVLRVLTNSCDGSIVRSVVDRRRKSSIQLDNSAVAAAPSSWTIDFEDDLCDATRCSSTRRGVIVYSDRNHLSVAGALTLTEPFGRAIARARP
jgi:SGNH domain (fused to AT3 domains)